MSVRIRLRRVGKRNAPAHRIVVVDQRSHRDGRFIESVGTYNPRSKSETVDLERINYWLSKGAQPSETVGAIVKRAKAGISWSGTQTAHHRKPVAGSGTTAAEEGEETVAEAESAGQQEESTSEGDGGEAADASAEEAEGSAEQETEKSP